MVLPAPAPHDVAGPDEPDWIERIKVILRLATRGVMILVDKATPLRLGELVRALLPEHPDLDVEVDATRLAAATPRQVVVLLPNPEQAEWLNRERPIIAERQLSVILFSDAETSKVLAQRAVDFFHWISHRVECPPQDVPTFAVARLRAAMLTRPRAIVWRGGNLEACFIAVRRSLVPEAEFRPAWLSYEGLCAPRKGESQWLIFENLDDPRGLQRVRWAIADAGWRGRVILVEPSDDLPGFPVVHGEPSSLTAAIESLVAAKSSHPGRLAALVNLDPTEIRTLSERLRDGEDEVALERATSAAARATSAELGALTRAPPSSRYGKELCSRDTDPIELALRTQPRNLRWLADRARDDAYPDVAAEWMLRWIRSQPDPKHALASVACAWRNSSALWLLYDRAGEKPDPALFELDPAEFADLTATYERQIASLKHSAQHLRTQNAHLLLATAHITRTLPPPGERDARGHDGKTEELLRRALAALEEGEHTKPRLQTQVLAELGAALRAQGRYADAESFLDRGAAFAAEKLGEGDPLTATLWSALAQVRAQLHRDDARETADRAIRLMTRALPIDDPRRIEDLPVLERIAGTPPARAE